jgi:hypothetical protein
MLPHPALKLESTHPEGAGARLAAAGVGEESRQPQAAVPGPFAAAAGRVARRAHREDRTDSAGSAGRSNQTPATADTVSA